MNPSNDNYDTILKQVLDAISTLEPMAQNRVLKDAVTRLCVERQTQAEELQEQAKYLNQSVSELQKNIV